MLASSSLSFDSYLQARTYVEMVYVVASFFVSSSVHEIFANESRWFFWWRGLSQNQSDDSQGHQKHVPFHSFRAYRLNAGYRYHDINEIRAHIHNAIRTRRRIGGHLHRIRGVVGRVCACVLDHNRNGRDGKTASNR